MTTSDGEDVCICGEPSCPGCDCGTECPYAPGHPEGTKATEPLQSLIEASETLIANMYEGGEAYNDHEQEETSFQLYPDVRRLNATIALAKKHLAEQESVPVHRVPYPDGSE